MFELESCAKLKWCVSKFQEGVLFKTKLFQVGLWTSRKLLNALTEEIRLRLSSVVQKMKPRWRGLVVRTLTAWMISQWNPTHDRSSFCHPDRLTAQRTPVLHWLPVYCLYLKSFYESERSLRPSCMFSLLVPKSGLVNKADSVFAVWTPPAFSHRVFY